MTEYGVNGLSLAEVARRLGVQPPSLYKYFPSLAALHDALFRRGHERHLEAMRQAAAKAEPGIPALNAALDASGRWALANGALAQLMFWRPVPGFSPSPEAFAPSAGVDGVVVGVQPDVVA
jgi:AcrR family transcriptional regulator